MLDGMDYTGYTVIVKEIESKKTLLQTKILEQNRMQRSIFIANAPLLEGIAGKLSLFILGKDSIYEYYGIPRKTANPNRVELSLFKGKEKEDRVSKRYDLNIEATVFERKPPEVDASMGEGGAEKIPDTLTEMVGTSEEKKVKLLNLSSTGVLIDTEHGVLQNEDTFKLKLDIAGSATIILCKVLRIENAGDGYIHCGCQFIATNT